MFSSGITGICIYKDVEVTDKASGKFFRLDDCF